MLLEDGRPGGRIAVAYIFRCARCQSVNTNTSEFSVQAVLNPNFELSQLLPPDGWTIEDNTVLCPAHRGTRNDDERKVYIISSLRKPVLER